MTVHELHGRVRPAEAVVDAGGVDRGIVLEGRDVLLEIETEGGSQHAAVRRRRRDGPRVHERDGRHLPFRGLGALSALEVAGGVTDGESVVAGHVARAEAGTAETGFEHRAALDQRGDISFPDQREVGGLAARIDGEIERSRADRFPFEDVCGDGDVVVGAARASRDDALRHDDPAVHDLIREPERAGFQPEQLAAVLFGLLEDVAGMCDEFRERDHVGGMEGERDHGLHLVKLDDHRAVVERALTGSDASELLSPAVGGKIVPHLVVRHPDGTEACALRRHDVYAVAVLDGERGDALAHEFQHRVLDKTALESRPDERERDVLRTHALAHFAFEFHRYDAGIGDVICTPEQLLDKLRTALAHRHGAERAVTGVTVAAQDHLPRRREHLAHIAVDDGLVGGHINAAVLLCGGKPEDVIVLIDGAAHRAQTVVAVGEHIRHRELLEPARPRGLDDADIGDVVGRHGVELHPECRVIARGVVGGEHGIRHGALCGRVLALRRGHEGTVCETHLLVINFKHRKIPQLKTIIFHARA